MGVNNRQLTVDNDCVEYFINEKHCVHFWNAMQDRAVETTIYRVSMKMICLTTEDTKENTQRARNGKIDPSTTLRTGS